VNVILFTFPLVAVAKSCDVNIVNPSGVCNELFVSYVAGRMTDHTFPLNAAPSINPASFGREI
jgi:hypothetical protein